MHLPGLQRFFSALLIAFSISPSPATALPSDAATVEDEEPEWSPTEQIRDSIRRALDSDPRVPSARVGIAVGATMVALYGTVPDERAKRAALELTRAIPGVPRVLWDRLRVDAGPPVADARRQKAPGRFSIRKSAVSTWMIRR